MLDESLRNFKQKDFVNDLLTWFEQNKRDLPWRKTKNPYYIWVSEIMLQQTKVDTVIAYYDKFIKTYPSLEALASAEEQEVLKLWEGLGYYSRARHLHSAAQEVVERYGGEVPKDPKALEKLKGIGPYTKGAILSIAFNQAEPAVDGNVMRVLARILCIEDDVMKGKTRRRFEGIVRTIISREEPGAFNEALMELGALVCTPRNPSCSTCPVRSHCRAYATDRVDELPRRIRKIPQAKQEYLAFLLYNRSGEIALEQRPSTGLLANLWQFPMLEKTALQDKSVVELFAQRYGLAIKVEKKLGVVSHQFSHKKWSLTVYEAKLLKGEEDQSSLNFIPITNLSDYPMAVAHQKAQKLDARLSN